MANNTNSNNRVAKLKDRLQKERQARLKEREQLKTLRAENKELLKRPTADDVKKRTSELEGKLRSRSYKDAFAAAAKEAKVKVEHLDDLFDLAKLDLSADEPDPKAIKKALDTVLESRKWAIQADVDQGGEGDQADDNAEQATTPKKLQKDPNASRGGSSGPAGKFNVRRSQLSDKRWMQQNQAAYAEAAKAGNVHIING